MYNITGPLPSITVRNVAIWELIYSYSLKPPVKVIPEIVGKNTLSNYTAAYDLLTFKLTFIPEFELSRSFSE